MTTSARPTTADLLARLLAPEARADPFSVYRELRESGARRVEGQPLALITRHAEVSALLRDRRLSSSPLPLDQPPPPGPPMGFLFQDPPDHTRLRRLVTHAFTPRTVEKLRTAIVALTDELLDQLPVTGGTFDLVSALAHPLPVQVICRLLGVPVGDAEQLRSWIFAMSEGLDPLVATTPESARQDAARLAVAAQLRGRLAEVVAERRAAPREDLVSQLIAVRDAGDALTDAELISTCGLLLLAGNITTVNLIAHTVLHVLRAPGELDAVRADAQRIPRVVEEVLRVEPPAHVVTRRVVEDIPIGDEVLRRGDRVVLVLAAANRDPAEFSDPDRFDPDRPDVRRHLGFAAGAHYCVGAPLARLEASTALSRLVTRVEGLRLVSDPPVYKPDLTMRGPAAVQLHADRVLPREP